MSDGPHALYKPEFPRSNGYDPDWVMAGQMGPNVLWLTEWLGQEMRLAPGMRVLDLGCGSALSSVFLAREYGVRVWATDLWVSADDNWKRVLEAGAGELVCPVRAEAHALPFAAGFFDAVVSIDAYQYFGTDVLYLHYLSRFVRPGGEIGVVVPGLMQPLEGKPPEHLRSPQSNGKVFWEDECACFQTADWWGELWSRCTRVEEARADVLADGWRHWADFEEAVERSGKALFPSDTEALRADAGRLLGFVRLLATRSDIEGFNLYDPSLIASLSGGPAEEEQE